MLEEVFSGRSESDLAIVERRLRRIEGLLLAIAERLEMTPEDIQEAIRVKVSPEVAELVASGKRIAAVKLLREQENLGLLEAKSIIDDVAEQA